MHVQSNIEVPSCTYFCSGKAISITCCECECARARALARARVCVCVCVCVALFIQDAMRMRLIVICRLLRSKIFFHIISQTERLTQKMLLNINAYSNFLYSFCLKHFSF